MARGIPLIHQVEKTGPSSMRSATLRYEYVLTYGDTDATKRRSQNNMEAYLSIDMERWGVLIDA